MYGFSIYWFPKEEMVISKSMGPTVLQKSFMFLISGQGEARGRETMGTWAFSTVYEMKNGGLGSLLVFLLALLLLPLKSFPYDCDIISYAIWEDSARRLILAYPLIAYFPFLFWCLSSSVYNINGMVY